MVPQGAEGEAARVPDSGRTLARIVSARAFRIAVAVSIGVYASADAHRLQLAEIVVGRLHARAEHDLRDCVVAGNDAAGRSGVLFAVEVAVRL